MLAISTLVAVDIPPDPPKKKGCNIAGEGSPVTLALVLALGLLLRRRR